MISFYELAETLTNQLGKPVTYTDVWKVAKLLSLPTVDVVVTRERRVKGLRENYAEVLMDYFLNKRQRRRRRNLSREDDGFD